MSAPTPRQEPHDEATNPNMTAIRGPADDHPITASTPLPTPTDDKPLTDADLTPRESAIKEAVIKQINDKQDAEFGGVVVFIMALLAVIFIRSRCSCKW
ncbi:hypothetical protein NX059_011389 [Plenodomus lindquistii]|nr:hypothetical protein NX059_011389 [Plenodomus lindquistii]